MVLTACFCLSSIDASDNSDHVDHMKYKDWAKWKLGSPLSRYSDYFTPSSSKIGSRTYLAVPDFYPYHTVDRNSLEYPSGTESVPDEIPNAETYELKKHDYDYHHHHPSEPVHHYSHHHFEPAPHINLYPPPQSESKQVYLPIPIQSAPVKKFDFSFWIWPLVFVIILPLVLGAILLPLALVFLMNLIFLLFTMRNNTTMLTDGQFNRVRSKEKVGKSIEEEDALNQLFMCLIESYEKYNPDNKTKL